MAKSKVGKVSASAGKFYVTVDKKKQLLPVGTLMAKSDIEKLVGKQVNVYFANKPSTYVIAIEPVVTIPKIPIILCYYPPPDPIFRTVQPEVQVALLKVMVEQKIMPVEVAEKFPAFAPAR